MRELHEKIKGLGIEHYGFVKARRLEGSVEYFTEREQKGLSSTFEEKDPYLRTDLTLGRKWVKTVISFAIPYFYDSHIAKGAYFSLYSQGKDYHAVVRKLLSEASSVLEEKGFRAEVFCDDNALPERLIAHMAGIGSIGKNHMLITRQHGSYVFLGEILTDWETETDERLPEDAISHSICGDCDICMRACPTSILNGEYYDTKRCLSYITQDKKVKDEDLDLFKGRLFGCDTCQRVCPLNKFARRSDIPEFKPLAYMRDPDLDEILAMDNETFRKYKETSSGWRGKKLLKRNAMIALASKGMEIGEEFADTEYLKDIRERLLRRYRL